MTTKPATPLPWKQEIPLGDGGEELRQNIIFAITAANAYPRLVAALRPMVEGTAWITDEQIETTRALLRELGEL